MRFAKPIARAFDMFLISSPSALNLGLTALHLVTTIMLTLLAIVTSFQIKQVNVFISNGQKNEVNTQATLSSAKVPHVNSYNVAIF